MNRILYKPEECRDGIITFSDIRAEHIRCVLRASHGRTVKVGELNGNLGDAEITSCEHGSVTLKLISTTPPKLFPWFDVLIAVPRPRAMKRLWPQLATFGVREIHLVRAAKVEKSYLTSHVLQPETYEPLLIEGLMQAGTTQMPTVTLHANLRDYFNSPAGDCSVPRLRLFAQPARCADSRLVAKSDLHPDTVPLLVIGTDGGWTNEEADAFHTRGFRDFALGERPLRTDTACVGLIALLYDRICRLREPCG